MTNSLEQYKVNVPEGQRGEWRIERFEVKEDDSRHFNTLFSEGRYIAPGIYTRLCRDHSFDDPIMSDTPAEIKDHLPFIHKASGYCLLNGLGLGVVLKAILAKPEVTHVDVVEIDQDVINLVWPTYQNSKATLFCADAYTIQWPKDKRWDCIWHDIWPNICTDNLEGIAKLKHKYAHKTKYQAAWVEDLLRYYKRQGR